MDYSVMGCEISAAAVSNTPHLTRPQIPLTLTLGDYACRKLGRSQAGNCLYTRANFHRLLEFIAENILTAKCSPLFQLAEHPLPRRFVHIRPAGHFFIARSFTKSLSLVLPSSLNNFHNFRASPDIRMQTSNDRFID